MGNILIINLGSVSSKIAVFDNETSLFEKTIEHKAQDLACFDKILDQKEFRRTLIEQAVADAGYKMETFAAVCSRGGTLKPIQSGTYLIDEDVVADAVNPEIGGRHASTLGVVIASEIAKEYGIPAYFLDPVSTDEMTEEAHYTGYKGMYRQSMFHALNQKARGREVAQKLGKPYESLNLIGVHMGGGVDVSGHFQGRVIDTYDVRNDGCFSMDRCGNIPTTDVIDMCYSGLTKAEVKKKIFSEGGVFSYLGTKDFKEVESRVKNGDKEAEMVFRAMAYQHVKDIGTMAAALKFKVDAIFFTGGIAHSELFCNAMKEYIGDFAPVFVIPGENEMLSMAQGVTRVFAGGEVKKY